MIVYASNWACYDSDSTIYVNDILYKLYYIVMICLKHVGSLMRCIIDIYIYISCFVCLFDVVNACKYNMLQSTCT